MTTQTHIPRHWRYRLLRVLDVPETDENLRFLAAWQQAEGSASQYNPLNTTYTLPWGSWPFNNSGVKNYRTPVDGICATALTLDQSYYVNIVGALRAGTHTAEEIVGLARDEIKLWGTNPDTILDVLKTI